MLGISRIAIFNKIKQGKIKARKIGKRYLIPKSEFDTVFSGTALSSRQKRLIELGVKKTVNEYGEALKLLGQE